jgi:hypothetical protein
VLGVAVVGSTVAVLLTALVGVMVAAAALIVLVSDGVAGVAVLVPGGGSIAGGGWPSTPQACTSFTRLPL